MKKIKLLIFMLTFYTVILSVGCNNYNNQASKNETTRAYEKIQLNNGNNSNSFYRSDNEIDFSNIKFTLWDVESASRQVIKSEKKPYTIMVYMNGSDLESESGAATDDLIEMLESGVREELVNIILFTGGTNRWQNDLIPENDCCLWSIENGSIHKLASVGLVNMGDPGTLASFINFSIDNFPAEKYGLIMWDHGGGSIAGYGHDEKFNESNLTLLDMNLAFKQSALSKNKLEFLGFDSCLMATSEMAVVASDYSKYLIASEDLEPGDGWNYKFLSALNDNPNMNGDELGKIIVDEFMNYYGDDSDEILTMSVIDLSKIKQLSATLEDLMKKCSGSLADDRLSSFNVLARKRNGTKTFGEGTARDNECDMVDIGDMADKLSDLFPVEAANVIESLEDCVIYNRHNSDINLKGLSVYYIYGGREFGEESLDIYASLKVNDEHTNYLNNFYSILKNNNSIKRYRTNTQPQNDYDTLDDIINTNLTLWKAVPGKAEYYNLVGIKEGDYKADELSSIDKNISWPTINGKNICLYKINSTTEGTMFAIPSEVNGKDCDLIVLISTKYPDGKILGVRKEDGFVIQKGFDEIIDGDKIAFYYQEKFFGDNKNKQEINWIKGDEFTVKDGLKINWSKLENNKEYCYSIQSTDVWQNTFFSELKNLGALPQTLT